MHTLVLVMSLVVLSMTGCSSEAKSGVGCTAQNIQLVESAVKEVPPPPEAQPQDSAKVAACSGSPGADQKFSFSGSREGLFEYYANTLTKLGWSTSTVPQEDPKNSRSYTKQANGGASLYFSVHVGSEQKSYTIYTFLGPN